MLRKKLRWRPLTLFVSALILPSLVLATDTKQVVEEPDLPNSGKSTRRIIQSRKSIQPAPGMVVLGSPAGQNGASAENGELLTGADRSHRLAPLAATASLQDVRPWTAPVEAERTLRADSETGPSVKDEAGRLSAVYGPVSGSLYWLEQLSPDGPQRIHVDRWADGFSDCQYDIAPEDAGLEEGGFPILLDVAFSDAHLFVASNVFARNGGGFQGAYIARLPLAEISACKAAAADVYSDKAFGSFRLPKNAAGTMYFADHETASALRVWSWAADDASPKSRVRAIQPFAAGLRVCAAGDLANRCVGLDSRILDATLVGDGVAFFWSAQRNPAGGFPFAYTQGALVAGESLELLEEPLVWSEEAAWVLPEAAPGAGLTALHR